MHTESEVISLFCENAVATSGHLGGLAVDIWPEGSSGFVADPYLMEKMRTVMHANGFCRLGSEGWHFDYTGSGCQTPQTYTVGGTSYDPVKDCTGSCKWDYRRHRTS